MLTARGEGRQGGRPDAGPTTTKPFSTNELLARIRAVLRRRAGGNWTRR